MAYRIEITKIETKPALKEYLYYFTEQEMVERIKNDRDADKYEYRKYEGTEKIESEIYKQTIEEEPHLMEVINAFNKANPKNAF